MRNRLATSAKTLILLVFACCAALPGYGQEILGTNFGIPGTSPVVAWPRGFSLEALEPYRLYPNGAEFGLSNTSGGFGMIGSGRISGVGLAQPAVLGFMRQEIERPYAYLGHLTDVFNQQKAFSAEALNYALGGSYRAGIQREALPLEGGSALNATDVILQDRPTTTESILAPNP